MKSQCRLLQGLYRDSVALMQLSNTVSALEGVDEAYAVMGTPANLDLLREAGVDTANITARPNDLVIYVSGEDEEAISAALDRAEVELREEKRESAEGAEERPPTSLREGVQRLPGANMVLISTPGEYATAEALKALGLGLHVMLFSDNVSLEDEILLKLDAHERGLLVMGPDCGTAIINGLPLGFANVVKRGNIGLIGASGTGLQQVTSLIDRWGGGVSQAIGTGSHDLHARVGAITMLDALHALAEDASTEVIVLISKPPAPEIAERVLERARATGKPVVVDFIGAGIGEGSYDRLHVVQTLEEAAALAVLLAGGESPALEGAESLGDRVWRWTEEQRYVRGLFSGGTFSYEATLLLARSLGKVYSNTPAEPRHAIKDPWHSMEHTTVDLGDDLFTRGRPHPMIDYRLRVERIEDEARDPEAAVILLDVVLGHGSHPDPASELVPAIARAQEIAGSDGRSLVFVASVCGTERDPQRLSRQEEALRQAGVVLGRSNAEAARLAVRVVEQTRGGPATSQGSHHAAKGVTAANT